MSNKRSFADITGMTPEEFSVSEFQSYAAQHLYYLAEELGEDFEELLSAYHQDLKPKGD